MIIKDPFHSNIALSEIFSFCIINLFHRGSFYLGDMVCNILSNILLLMDCLIISMNECKIDEFDAETFPVIVPVNLALLEK